MAKKALEEKIKLVWIWALILSVIYFVISAWLMSDGYKIDSIKTYNLIKDTLTLAAAFLAPVIALVLFTDWKVEHMTISNEKITQDIHNSIKDIDVLLNFGVTTDKDEFNKVTANIYGLISSLNTNKDLLRLCEDAVVEYQDNVGKLIELCRELIASYTSSVLANSAVNKERVPNSSYEHTPKFKLEMSNVEKYTTQMDSIKEKIKLKVVELKPLFIK